MSHERANRELCETCWIVYADADDDFIRSSASFDPKQEISLCKLGKHKSE